MCFRLCINHFGRYGGRRKSIQNRCQAEIGPKAAQDGLKLSLNPRRHFLEKSSQRVNPIEWKFELEQLVQWSENKSDKKRCLQRAPMNSMHSIVSNPWIPWYNLRFQRALYFHDAAQLHDTLEVRRSCASILNYYHYYYFYDFSHKKFSFRKTMETTTNQK